MFRGRKSRKTILGLLEALQIQQKHNKDVEGKGGKKQSKDGTEPVSTRGNHTKQLITNFCPNNFI